MSTFNHNSLVETGDLNDIVTEQPYGDGLSISHGPAHTDFIDTALQCEDYEFLVTHMDDSSLAHFDTPSMTVLDNAFIDHDTATSIDNSTNIARRIHANTFDLPHPHLGGQQSIARSVEHTQVPNAHNMHQPITTFPNFHNFSQPTQNNNNQQAVLPNHRVPSPSVNVAVQTHQNTSNQQDTCPGGVQPAPASISPQFPAQSSSSLPKNTVHPASPSVVPAPNSVHSSASRPPAAPLTNSTQSKTKRLKVPNNRTIPSHYCHICGRNSRIEFGHCVNIKLGLCRKVVCEKCLILHEPDSRQKALDPNSDWVCIHCRHLCPERARCKQYTKNNHKRREKRAKERMERERGSNRIGAAADVAESAEATEWETPTTTNPLNNASGSHDQHFQPGLPMVHPSQSSVERGRQDQSDIASASQTAPLPTSSSAMTESSGHTTDNKTSERQESFFKLEDASSSSKFPVYAAGLTRLANQTIPAIRIPSSRGTQARIPQPQRSNEAVSPGMQRNQSTASFHASANAIAQDGIRCSFLVTKDGPSLRTKEARQHETDSRISCTTSLTTSPQERSNTKCENTLHKSTPSINVRASQPVGVKREGKYWQPNLKTFSSAGMETSSPHQPSKSTVAASKDDAITRPTATGPILSQHGQSTQKNSPKDELVITGQRHTGRTHGLAASSSHEQKTKCDIRRDELAVQSPKATQKRKRVTEQCDESASIRRKASQTQTNSTNAAVSGMGEGGHGVRAWREQLRDSERGEVDMITFDSRKYLHESISGNGMHDMAENAPGTANDLFPNIVDAEQHGVRRMKSSDAAAVEEIANSQEEGPECCESPAGISEAAFVSDGDSLLDVGFW